jgi:hypothetical protein
MPLLLLVVVLHLLPRDKRSRAVALDAAATAAGAVPIAPREKKEEEQQLLMLVLLVLCSLQVVEVGVGSHCGGNKTND